MAVVLDINMLCKKAIDFNILEKVIKEYGVTIDSINCIDNWMWDNEQQVEDFDQIKEELVNNKIIIIKFNLALIKDLGMYIEKIKSDYIYTLWINTEGYPNLDCDMVTLENKDYYEKVYQIIMEMERSVPNLLQVVGIGIESDFHYSEEIMEIIQCSRNIIVWILQSDAKIEGILRNCKKKSIKGTDKIIFEKME